MALRIKAGGPTSVISAADAKKSGLIKTTSTAPTTKPVAVPDKPRPTTAATTEKKPDEKKPVA